MSSPAFQPSPREAGTLLGSFDTVSAVAVNVHWGGAELDCDVVAFGLTTEGKVPADTAFVFYNNPETPAGLIMVRRSHDPADPCRAQVLVDLAEPSPAIRRIRIAMATVTEASLSGLRGIRADVVDLRTGQRLIRQELGNVVHTRCAVLADIVADGDSWYYLPAVTFRTDGLDGLATSLGVNLV